VKGNVGPGQPIMSWGLSPGSTATCGACLDNPSYHGSSGLRLPGAILDQAPDSMHTRPDRCWEADEHVLRVMAECVVRVEEQGMA
jgi:hypothetical protein